MGAAVALVLVVFAGGYGPHRDELYFLAAGEHLAWSSPDQGPVTPLIARAMDLLAPGSLTVLRVPSALMAGLTVVLAGVLAAELGGGRRAQLLAAACTAVASVVLIVGHLLSTTTFDVLAWTVVTWLVVRALRTGHGPLWLAVGAVAGVALLNKPLIAFLLVALAIGALVAGPRELVRSPWVWGGAALALALWSPWLVWQASHDWPQLEVSAAIAAGGSASSAPRWAFLPFQLLLVSPVLAPVWIAGLVALARRPPYRLLAAAWLVLVVVFLVTGGKPYYLAGLFPALLAAGAIVVDRWLVGRGRAVLVWAAVGLSALVSATIALPILPADAAGPVIAANADVGETIGWPEFVRTVAGAAEGLEDPVVFTRNYGQAGAIDRYGPALGLPRAYSGHNGYAEWGPPPDRPGPVVLVGLPEEDVRGLFDACQVAAEIDNAAGIHNDEQGTRVHVCAGPRMPWSRTWDDLRRLG